MNIPRNKTKLRAYAVARNVALESPFACCAYKNGWECSLPKGHYGDHEAWYSRPLVFAQPYGLMHAWPAEDGVETQGGVAAIIALLMRPIPCSERVFGLWCSLPRNHGGHHEAWTANLEKRLLTWLDVKSPWSAEEDNISMHFYW